MAESSGYPQIVLNPDADLQRLTWENHVVLAAVQASLGNIGPDVRGIAVEAGKDRVTFHVALTQRSAKGDEDIEDMLSEFEAVTGGYVRGTFALDTLVTVGDTGPEWSGYRWRRIFLAHA
ncbi:hypothetical protein [Catellatospora citrea]|uniref:Uncharacterized protein n=1 Tax=Catellatospora citrea TaxID=53366 RepID=A0A8J3KJT1_9ACTN|nr:hypothetical protein [Catellatospora citrea]RKE10734.1 hypothetical protein C8E86_5651 [Catellatospora citrea]GIG01132.1 hypothetical protein Cci01nite_62250 [Catellatospora citrea]